MLRIFMCYRREDSAGHAGRLFDRLRDKFGTDGVFMDVAGIDGGVDFHEAIKREVGSCDVLLAVIGRQWATGTDGRGRRRLDDPEDFVRLEIGAALARNVRVIPVLVDGARIPAMDLPEDLEPLRRRQAVELRDNRWNADVEDLITLLGRIPAGPKPPGPVKGRSRILWAAALVSAAALAALAFLFARGVAVPDVVGQTREAAVENLRLSGLETIAETTESAEGVPAGQVVGQSPPAGTRVAHNARITLVLASPERHLPPGVGGVASATVEDAALVAHCVQRWSGPSEVGVACRAGEVLSGGGCTCPFGTLRSSYPSGGSEGVPASAWQCDGECPRGLKALAMCCDANTP